MRKSKGLREDRMNEKVLIQTKQTVNRRLYKYMMNEEGMLQD